VQTILDVGLSGFAILFGILFGSLYNRLRQFEGHLNLGRELIETFQSSRFITSLLIAPLIFGGVYVAAKTQPDRVVAFLFAFSKRFLLRKHRPPRL